MERLSPMLGVFLETFLHTLLYARHLCPSSLFEIHRQFNHTFIKSRHPLHNSFIKQLVESLLPSLVPGEMQRLVIAVLDRSYDRSAYSAPVPKCLERFVLEVRPLTRPHCQLHAAACS